MLNQILENFLRIAGAAIGSPRGFRPLREGGGSDHVVGGGLAPAAVSVMCMARRCYRAGWQTGMKWLGSGQGPGRQIPVGVTSVGSASWRGSAANGGRRRAGES